VKSCVLSAAALILPSALAAQAAAEECPQGSGENLTVGLEGRVSDAITGVRLPRAIVVLRYVEEPGKETPSGLTVQADEDGRYVICGLQAFRTVTLQAGYRRQPGETETVVLERSREVDLTIELGDPAFMLFRVRDASNGSPIEGASVRLAPTGLSAFTDSLGQGAFRRVPPGDYEATFERIGYADRIEPLTVENDQLAELVVEMVPQAVALEPLEVRVTGRDPYLVTSGFYDRRMALGDDGYFGTWEEIEPYRMVSTLFEFQTDLTVRFHAARVVLLNGRPMDRLGYESVNDLREIPYSRIRGVEAYACTEAPDHFLRWVPVDMGLTECNLIVIWTR
jgi:hypothetical protein